MYTFNHATSNSSLINDEGLFKPTKGEPWGLIASISFAHDIKCGFSTMLPAWSNFIPESGSKGTVDFNEMVINSGTDSLSYPAPAQPEAEEKPTRQIPVTLLSGFLVSISRKIATASS